MLVVNVNHVSTCRIFYDISKSLITRSSFINASLFETILSLTFERKFRSQRKILSYSAFWLNWTLRKVSEWIWSLVNVILATLTLISTIMLIELIDLISKIENDKMIINSNLTSTILNFLIFILIQNNMKNDFHLITLHINSKIQLIKIRKISINSSSKSLFQLQSSYHSSSNFCNWSSKANQIRRIKRERSLTLRQAKKDSIIVLTRSEHTLSTRKMNLRKTFTKSKIKSKRIITLTTKISHIMSQIVRMMRKLSISFHLFLRRRQSLVVVIVKSLFRSIIICISIFVSAAQR